MNAVLFVGHGSRDSEGNDEVRAFVESIGERTGQPIVETCFLEFEPPTVGAGIERCVERGATHIVVIPIMLFSAGHAKAAHSGDDRRSEAALSECPLYIRTACRRARAGAGDSGLQAGGGGHAREAGGGGYGYSAGRPRER